MKLTLDPRDLAKEYQKNTPRGVDQACSTPDVTFDKLNEKAQAAVRVVGYATYYAWNESYNAILAPK